SLAVRVDFRSDRASKASDCPIVPSRVVVLSGLHEPHDNGALQWPAVLAHVLYLLTRLTICAVCQHPEHTGIAFPQCCCKRTLNCLSIAFEDHPGDLSRHVAFGPAARIATLPRLPRFQIRSTSRQCLPPFSAIVITTPLRTVGKQ